MKTRIIQIAAGATPGDAITNEIAILHQHFEQTFSASQVYAEHIAPGLPFPVQPPTAYRPATRDVIVFHHSISMQSADAVCRLDLPRVMIYHNITPAHFFLPYNPVIAEHLTKARRELGRLSHHFDFCYGDSDFNRREIAATGHAATAVLPVFFPRVETKARDQAARRQGKTDAPVLLFVGRIVPNKSHADLIKMLFFLRRIVPGARLVLAGSEHAGIPSYTEELHRLTQYLGLTGAVTITGYLSERELDSWYDQADLFISASRHEGFCVPLLEAMLHGLPVLAYTGTSSAVEETLDGAGVQYTQMDHASMASMAARMITDRGFRAAVLRGQETRLAKIDPAGVLAEMTSRLKKLASD